MKSQNELKRERDIEMMLSKTSERLFVLEVDSENMTIPKIQKALEKMRMDIEAVLQNKEIER